jgi:ATP-dependent helicase/DNAse subunit B
MLLALEKISPYLHEYTGVSENADFSEKALAIVKEMRACKVSAKMLEDACEKLENEGGDAVLCGKLRDIALISEAYDASLSTIPGSVSDIYEKLCEKLRNGNFFGNTDVFFDSFYGFTKREYEIISLICEQADNTYVTFSCRNDCDKAIFERSLDASAKCKNVGAPL